MRFWPFLLVGVAPAAYADEGISVRTQVERSTDGPLLELDPMLRPAIVGLGAEREQHATTISIADATKLVLAGESWQNVDRPEAGKLAIDLEARGWDAGVQLSHDFGPFELIASWTTSEAGDRYRRGRYTQQGIAIRRTFDLSRWMKAWIMLGVTRRRWDGDEPPEGEADGVEATLSIGTTFR